MPESRCERSADGRHRWLKLAAGRICQACFVVESDVPQDGDPAFHPR